LEKCYRRIENVMLSIKQFSERTGLSTSALRFYETKDILVPAARLESGHRKYEEDQISQARLVHSLRQAQISLMDISEFLRTAPLEREKLLIRWRHESEVKLLSVQVANQFLQGFSQDRTELHLVNFDDELFMIWFTVSVINLGSLPFMDVIQKQLKKLNSYGVKVLDYGFVRTISAYGKEVVGEIGFQIRPNDVRKVSDSSPKYIIREIPYALFATLEYKSGETYVCYRILSILNQFGFEPIGDHYDKYMFDNQDRIILYVPIAKKA
jgi:DNA-binding transcriptional MerR regulator